MVFQLEEVQLLADFFSTNAVKLERLVNLFEVEVEVCLVCVKRELHVQLVKDLRNLLHFPSELFLHKLPSEMQIVLTFKFSTGEKHRLLNLIAFKVFLLGVFPWTRRVFLFLSCALVLLCSKTPKEHFQCSQTPLHLSQRRKSYDDESA